MFKDMMKFIIANIEDSHAITDILKSMQQSTVSPNTGIGWLQPGYIEKIFGHKTIVWHNGRVGGYASYVAVDQHTNTGVVILSNSSTDITMLGIMLMRQIRTQSWKP
jgi:CubicO group peptidase (beta-lactamase class C family)